ncbi:M56 family metallopeptidase [Paenibacillus harenae]|uniref:M56 family metallopeptidase n=1 Tax=Paenibacillus harenae TaxID=306543 RepID=UPI000420DEBA|nr:M56 family metallopeptidase [Paenibacillus harenae]
MTGFFTTILNMSITASYAAIAVMVGRIFFKNLPKIFSYALWMAVLIRLVFPFSFQSAFSFLHLLPPREQANPSVMENAPGSIGLIPVETMDAEMDGKAQSLLSLIHPGSPELSAYPLQSLLEIASILWLAGVAILLIYSLVSYIRVNSNVKTATLVKDNIFETDRITSPFVFGLIKPRIYIPVGLDKDELSYVIAHEQTHIRRLDYLVKPFAFVTLIVHWFNPVLWLAYSLMSKDMEMSCDESVIRKMGTDQKASYSRSLLSLSVKRNGLLTGSPLAFGESHIKSRIKNILTYKKPDIWVIAAAVLVTAASIALLTANPEYEAKAEPNSSAALYDTKLLMANKTPYVGNQSKVVALIEAMPFPSGYRRDTVELQTVQPPYGLTIHVIGASTSETLQHTDFEDVFFPNAVLLFSLIDNVDVISYKAADKGGQGEITGFTYTRDKAEEWNGGDVRYHADSAEALNKLIARMFNHSSESIAIGTQIEKSLEIIQSSPKFSSNPGDYIEAHRDEYERILRTDEEALAYLFAEFENGNIQNDLRGHIIMSVCKDLLGERDNVKDESLLPLQWYDELVL